jgi:hypothetical protein
MTKKTLEEFLTIKLDLYVDRYSNNITDNPVNIEYKKYITLSGSIDNNLEIIDERLNKSMGSITTMILKVTKDNVIGYKMEKLIKGWVKDYAYGNIQNQISLVKYYNDLPFITKLYKKLKHKKNY